MYASHVSDPHVFSHAPDLAVTVLLVKDGPLKA